MIVAVRQGETPQQLKRRLKAEQIELGCEPSFFEPWPSRGTYYRADGEALPNLPANPSSMRRYLDRGLSLCPPKNSNQQYICSDCNFKATSAFGLQAHQRKHQRSVIIDVGKNGLPKAVPLEEYKVSLEKD